MSDVFCGPRCPMWYCCKDECFLQKAKAKAAEKE